ncbi:MAG: acylneuraminate cytidylyltransferase family protein [Candidatus Margulisiibacteriota bacterium]
MIETSKKKVLAIIPARGASKGVPKKNLRRLQDKPLLAWTILVAKKSKYINRLILSSDDDEIIRIAKSYNCEVPFVRPLELAKDDTPGIDPIIHALETLEEKYDFVVLLQVTSPLRIAEDIDQCLEALLLNDAPASVSVTISKENPYWMFVLDRNKRMIPVIQDGKQYFRRQDIPDVYLLNGAVYCSKVEWLLKTRSFICDQTVAYVMPPERSIDIDSENDLLRCEHLLAGGRG